MSKYRNIAFWKDIPKDCWYDMGGYKGYCFSNGLTIDRKVIYGYIPQYYYLDTEGKAYSRTSFKLEYKLRSTKVWKALYNVN